MTYVNWPASTSGGITLDELITGGATAGSILFAASGNAMAQDNANLYWDDTNNRMGLGTTSPGSAATSAMLDIFAWSILLGADNTTPTTRTRTDATAKQCTLVGPHYTNSEEPVLVIGVASSSGANGIQIGGGLGQYNACTSITFTAASGTTTVVGTQIGLWSSTGFIIGNTQTTTGRITIQEDNALTGSAKPLIYGTVTWNAGGTTHLGQQIIVTDTASAAASLLQDWKIGANSVFTIRKDGRPQFLGNTAVPAGGTAGLGVLWSSTTNLGIFSGTGAPSLSAGKGSLYTNTTASTTTTRLYVNTDGGTTWASFTSSA